MAVGRIQVNAGKKGKGIPHFSYIMAQDKYTKKQIELAYTQSGNMPDWAIDNPKLFWQMADDYERANGTSYREHILTLPREFNLEQNLSLIDAWIKQAIPNQPYSFAIHNPKASDGKEQPHCHLMFSERLDDGIKRTPDQYFKRYNSKNPEKGGVKKINTGLSPKERRENIKSLRSDWGDCLNRHLRQYNFIADIDMRNWKERGLSSPPINKPLSHYKMEKRIENTSDKTILAYILENEATENRYPIIKFDNSLILKLAEFGQSKTSQEELERMEVMWEEQLQNRPEPKPTTSSIDPTSKADKLKAINEVQKWYQEICHPMSEQCNRTTYRIYANATELMSLVATPPSMLSDEKLERITELHQRFESVSNTADKKNPHDASIIVQTAKALKQVQEIQSAYDSPSESIKLNKFQAFAQEQEQELQAYSQPQGRETSHQVHGNLVFRR